MENYFEYTVKRFQEFRSQDLITMRFPKSMEKEVRDLSRWTEVTFTMIFDKIAEEWERQYFHRDKVELSPDINKIKKR